MTPSGVKTLIFSSSSFRSLLSVTAVFLVLSAILLVPEIEGRKVSRYNRKEFREYLAAKRRASEAERRAYYEQQFGVYNACPQGFSKGRDGKCYLNLPSVSRFAKNNAAVQHHGQFVQNAQHFGPNPFQLQQQQQGHVRYVRESEQHGRHRFGHSHQVSRIQRSPEQHGRHRFGHPIPENLRQRRSPVQHGRHRFGHPIPPVTRVQRSPEQHGRHRFGHPIPEARQRRSPLQHGRHRFGHPIPDARRQKRSPEPEQHGRHRYGHPLPENRRQRS